MFVEFWPVGANNPVTLPMSPESISGHLLADWTPSLPPSAASSFMGWPSFLIEPTTFLDTELLALADEATHAERQWKVFFSWMLGVAGTRHVLADDGYRWLAPLSAFYPEAQQEIDLTRWHPDFPRSVLTAARRPERLSNLRPDYVALRSTASPGSYDWAIAESKGTQACLTNAQSCPTPWRNQVRSVQLTRNGSVLAIPRHLVVATRVNPNAVRLSTRRLQVRAWNSTATPEGNLMPEAAVEIAAAHLFGIFRNLGLRANAQAIAWSVQMRADARRQHGQSSMKRQVDELAANAAAELAASEDANIEEEEDGRKPLVVFAPTDIGPVEVAISSLIVDFARDLLITDNSDAAAEALRETDGKLDKWQQLQNSKTRDSSTVILPFGVRVTLPSRFRHR